MIRLLIIGDMTSAHIIKWVNALADFGVDVHLWSLHDSETKDEYRISEDRFYGPKVAKINADEGAFSKISYLLYVSHLKQIIKLVKPDIVHAHYISSYGFLAALSGFNPLVVSVWGSDIMSFAERSKLHSTLIKWIMRKSDILQASGEYLANFVNKYNSEKTRIVHFGLPDDFFSEDAGKSSAKDSITIGTIKSFEPHYDIPVLIRAFSILTMSNSDFSGKIRLLLVGSGSEENNLRLLVKELNLTDRVTFTGKVPFSKIGAYHKMIDTHICPSKRESFGVSILEAMAVGRPVIASDIPAFDELVSDNITGLRFRSGDAEDLADKISTLLFNSGLQEELSRAAYQRALQYKMTRCISSQLAIYDGLLRRPKNE